MKKTLAILLSIVCLTSALSGCGLVDAFKEGFEEGYQSAQNQDRDELTETNDRTDDDNVIVDEDEKDDNNSENSNNEEKEEVVYKFGTVNGTTYQNEFAGVSCTLPSSWVYYSEEEVKALNNITIDKLDEEIAEMVKNATIIYDMCAVESSTGSSININFEKLPATLMVVDVKAILEEQVENTKVSLESVGATNVDVQYKQVNVDGKTFDALCNTAEMSGTKINQTIVAYHCNGYLVYITVTATSNELVENILSNFSFN